MSFSYKLGLQDYYQGKIEELEIVVRDKQQNLRRLEAQRNDLNAKGPFLSCPLMQFVAYLSFRFG